MVNKEQLEQLELDIRNILEGEVKEIVENLYFS